MPWLHTVELQLLMHFLQPRELLHLARTCQTTLAAADAPFAWKHTPPIRTTNVARPPRPISQTRLLRIAATAIEWIPSVANSPDDVLQLLANHVRVHELVGRAANNRTCGGNPPLATFLSHPVVQPYLRVLHTSS